MWLSLWLLIELKSLRTAVAVGGAHSTDGGRLFHAIAGARSAASRFGDGVRARTRVGSEPALSLLYHWRRQMGASSAASVALARALVTPDGSRTASSCAPATRIEIGLIRPAPSVRATADAARGERRLSSGQNQATLPLHATWGMLVDSILVGARVWPQ
jgi:hypothetical protein